MNKRWQRSKPFGFVARATARAGMLGLVLLGACGQDLYVGSDLLWTARHEGGDLSEWNLPPGGRVEAVAPNAVQISTAQVHQGQFAVRLSITTATAGVQENAVLGRAGGLPLEAYYSAWYYLPQAASVGMFWVVMKFRARSAPDDATTVGELYDLDLRTLAGGEMSLRLFSHRRGGDIPLDVPDPVVPIQRWFHLEAFYRNTQDDTGRLTYWLDGRPIVDVRGPSMATNSWVGWQACSVGENLSPTTALLYVDDAAISKTRVGPEGLIAR